MPEKKHGTEPVHQRGTEKGEEVVRGAGKEAGRHDTGIRGAGRRTGKSTARSASGVVNSTKVVDPHSPYLPPS